MASRRSGEVRFTVGLSLFWFALSYQFSPGAFSGTDVSPDALSVGLGSFAQSGCIIAMAIAYAALSHRRDGNASRTGDGGTATLLPARFRHLVALVVRQASERARFLRVLVFFMLVCVAVSYLVVMLINDRPDLCQQIVLPTRILALFLLWETALMYSASARTAPAAAVAALYQVPIGVEVSFPVFAGFVSPLLSGLSVYLWLGACIIPAILLLILAVLKMQGAAGAQANAGPSEQAVATAEGALVNTRSGGSAPIPTEKGAGSQEPAESAPAPNASGPTALNARCAALASRHSLTPRESEVLRLLAAGNSQRKIADVLVVSLSSAQTYSKNVYRKLGVHSRQEVIDLVSQSD